MNLFFWAFLFALAGVPSYSDARQLDFSIASDVLIYVGDGIGDLESLEQRLSFFTPPIDAPVKVYNAYTEGRAGLRQLLQDARQGKDVSWFAPLELSKSFRQIIEYQAQLNQDASFFLEYITFRYLSRHYLGLVDTAPSSNMYMTSRTESELVKYLEDMLNAGLGVRERRNWNFIKRAALDVDSSMTGWNTVSGLPLAPLPFHKATRYLIGRIPPDNL